MFVFLTLIAVNKNVLKLERKPMSGMHDAEKQLQNALKALESAADNLFNSSTDLYQINLICRRFLTK